MMTQFCHWVIPKPRCEAPEGHRSRKPDLDRPGPENAMEKRETDSKETDRWDRGQRIPIDTQDEI
jgi:hypothetical protein